MADSSTATKVSEENLAKSEELKNKANEFFKGSKVISTECFPDNANACFVY